MREIFNLSAKNERFESIYSLAPKPPEVQVKPQRYFSVHSKKVKDDSIRNRFSHRSMGYAKTPLTPPGDFLKRRTFQTSSIGNTSAKSFRYPDSEFRKPRLPKPFERPSTCGAERNFVRENSSRNSSATFQNGRRRAPKMVYTSKGDSFELDKSGLLPIYTNKKDYGIVPKYIQEFVEKTANQRQLEENERKMEETKKSLQRLEDQEKYEILKGLKRNLGQLQIQYLNLSVIIDTPSKRNRKSNLESQISQLEKDINLLERYRHIYIQPL